jgi:hypothetical protein
VEFYVGSVLVQMRSGMKYSKWNRMYWHLTVVHWV